MGHACTSTTLEKMRSPRLTFCLLSLAHGLCLQIRICLFVLVEGHHSSCMGVLQKCPFPLPPGPALVGEQHDLNKGHGHPCFQTGNMLPHVGAQLGYLSSFSCCIQRALVTLLCCNFISSHPSRQAHMYMHHAFTYITSWLARQ